MNNILSDAVIDRINNYDTRQLKSLFDDIMNDTQFSYRQNQQLGVNNRRKLIPATTYKPFGRDADGVPVYARPDSKGYTGDYEMNIKSHKDYVSMICSNKSGYMSGIEVVSENQQALDKVNEFLKINTFEATHIDLIDSTCAYATKSLRLYVDNGLITYTELEPWTYAPFYNKTGKLVGVMQWEEVTKEIQDTYSVGKYKVNYLNDNEDMYFYTDKKGAVLLPNTQDYPALVVSTGEINNTEGRRPHTFNGVPVVEFFNNDDKIGDVEKTLDSQDARDELVSKANTAFGAFADVLLVDRTKDENGLPEVTADDFKEMQRIMKDHGMVAGDWEWLIKDYTGYENVKNHLTLLESDIFEGSNSFNPNQKDDSGSSPTKYQIQQKYKPLIDSSVKTEMQFKRSYMELFRLILTQGLTTDNNNDYLDLTIIFQKTIPEDKILTLKTLREAGVPIPMELAYTVAGYKWDEIKPMLEEDRKSTLSEFDEEDVVE